MAELLDLDRVSHASNASAKLDKIVDVFEKAEALFRSYPSEVRDEIESFSHPIQATNVVASVLSTIHPSARYEMQESLNEVRKFVMDLMTTEDACMPIPDDELKIMTEMMVFVQKMGKKSLRQLYNFLVASNDNEWGSVLLTKEADGVEARHRFKLAPNVRDYFDM